MGTQRKKMGRGRLRLCFLLSLVAAAASIPAPQEDARESAQEDFNTEDMTNIFRDLFIPSREARELSDEDGDEDVQDVASDNEEEEDYKVMEDTEAMDEARVMEVARFNNYIAAIYRRMNAALRAKMMDPMELNLNDKAKKKTMKFTLLMMMKKMMMWQQQWKLIIEWGKMKTRREKGKKFPPAERKIMVKKAKERVRERIRKKEKQPK